MLLTLELTGIPGLCLMPAEGFPLLCQRMRAPAPPPLLLCPLLSRAHPLGSGYLYWTRSPFSPVPPQDRFAVAGFPPSSTLPPRGHFVPGRLPPLPELLRTSAGRASPSVISWHRWRSPRLLLLKHLAGHFVPWAILRPRCSRRASRCLRVCGGRRCARGVRPPGAGDFGTERKIISGV